MMRHTDRKRHTNIHKMFCGLVVAFALVLLPLPALADDSTGGPSGTPAPPASAPAAPAESTADTGTTDAANTNTPDPNLSLGTAQPQPALQSAPATTETTAGTTQTAQAGESRPDPTVKVENNSDSAATSGAAAVTNNETGGDATSGDTSATATAVNVANASGVTAPGFQTLECNISGDIQGNILVDPASLQQITGADADCRSTKPGSTSKPASTGGLQTSASLVDILNNIILSSNSGDATVDSNETGGDATSGDAVALANIVNIANTAIGSQSSFLGILNIYGSLKGNILVPQSFVDSLIGDTGASGLISETTHTTITNNLNASAASGNATVSGNETGGSANTGDAMTSLTVMNLTGQEVIAKNSLLVFVNVLGRWVGAIVPAPEGSTTAMLGSGIQPNSSSRRGSDDGKAGGTTTNITNNVSVGARSGDAAVTNNETGGDAASGDAKAGINLLNITDSNFFLQDWFGALFINVLGSWTGDFDILAAEQGSTDTPAKPVREVKVYQFTKPAVVSQASAPDQTAAAAAPTQANPAPAPDITETTAPAGSVLGATDTKLPAAPDAGGFRLNPAMLAALLLGLTLLIALATAAIRRRFADQAAR